MRAVFVPRRTDPEADGIVRVVAPERRDPAREAGASAARAARAAW